MTWKVNFCCLKIFEFWNIWSSKAWEASKFMIFEAWKAWDDKKLWSLWKLKINDSFSDTRHFYRQIRVFSYLNSNDFWSINRLIKQQISKNIQTLNQNSVFNETFVRFLAFSVKLKIQTILENYNSSSPSCVRAALELTNVTPDAEFMHSHDNKKSVWHQNTKKKTQKMSSSRIIIIIKTYILVKWSRWQTHF